MTTTTKILAAIGAGAAAGLLMGILFAPDKGVETRSKIAGKAKDCADEIKEKFEYVKNKFNSFKEKVKETENEKSDQFV